ncbi:MAG TPA: TetR family transcriptional regulator [Solirubrobacteraceae bacterium]|jgi:AcrR family transcriptional regulator|nr:TetR family transcriptional regulator [Solirubrobacteraceae bacterium]
MSQERSSSGGLEPAAGRGRRAASSRQLSAPVAEFQRSRLLKAALAVYTEHGYAAMTASAVIATAGVSRKTFYDLFADREDCYLALLEESLAEIATVVVPVYEDGGEWSQRLRAALAAALAFVEAEPQTGALVLSHMIGHGPASVEPRASVRELLARALEDGCPAKAAGEAASPLTAELVIGGVLAVVEGRLRASPRQLGALLNELMWMIVLPYAGSAAAGRQLRRRTPSEATPPPPSASGVPRPPRMRLTYRTASTLEAIARAPGASNKQVAAHMGMVDEGQISKLLSRLEGLGLIENTGAGQPKGMANAWHLTRPGAELEAAIRRRPAATR